MSSPGLSRGPIRLAYDSGRASGMSPQDIDLILPTHMHLDHGGWLIQDGMPYFPNAQVQIELP